MNVHYFKELWKSSLMVLLFCFGLTSLWGQTNPSTGDLPYTFNGDTSIPSTMAVHRFGTSSGAIPTTRTTNDGNANLPSTTTNNSGGYMIEGTNGADGISLLASGSQAAGAIVVEISTENKENITVSYIAWTKLDQASRTNSIALQYRVGDNGIWIDVDNPSSSVYSTSTTGRNNGVSFNQTLPVEANNKPIIQVRWIYWDSAGTTGSRDRLGIDDISINGSNIPTCTTPEFLFDEEVVNKIVIDEPFTNEFISDNTSAFVWSSTDTGVATVDANGEVTIVGAGTTEIRVNQAADDTYCAVVDAGYTLNVAAVTYAITATSNNEAFGTVSLAGNIITATPAAGYTYATPAYTVTEGSATVDQNGNEFTVTPSSDATVQINFEAKPLYTLSLVDDGSAYAEGSFPYTTYEGDSIELPTLADCGSYTFAGWDTNSSTTSTPTYAGGATYTTTGANVTLYAVYSETVGGGGTTTSTFGFEDGDTGWTHDTSQSNSNARTGSYSGRISTSSVYVTFDNIVASPQSITFYLMRTSNNTNTNIKVQISSNNSDWTDVATYLMSEFNNGSYTEKITDLSAHENVYVRLLYTGTTAIRHIDDISLTYGGGSTTVYTTTPGCNAPNLLVSESILSDFNYVAGSGPSASQDFVVSGVNLDDSAITVTAPASFEVSADDETFAGSLNLSSTDGTLGATTIYVRLAAGLTANTYNGNITISGGTAPEVTVAVSGEVIDYCMPTSEANDESGITSVSFADINNTSVGDPLYSDFTAITAHVIAGNSYDLIVGVNTFEGNTYIVKAWIDWNKDYEFDAGEQYNVGNAFDNGTTSPFSITIPVDTEVGEYRMRIRTMWEPSGVLTACEEVDYTEAEDYTITVIPTPSFSLSVNSINGFTYVAGSGPSTSDSFTVSGVNLDGSAITVTAPANFEVSADDETFASSLNLSSTDGTLAETTVYVRLMAGLTANTYSGDIAVSGGGAANAIVSVSGAVSDVPAVTEADDLTAQVGVEYSYQIIATDEPFSYVISSVALPAGLSLNEETGLISGIPTVAGEFIFGVTATNTVGTSDEAVFMIDIEKGIQAVTGLENINAFVGNADITLPETTEQGIIIEYISNNETVATVSGNILTIVGIGTVEIVAENNGNSNYETYTGEFTVTVTEAPITPTAGMLYITEVADASNANNEYLEIYNNTGNAIDMTGSKIKMLSDNTTWVFGDGLATATIPARGFLILTRNSDQNAFESAYGSLNANTVLVKGTNGQFFGTGTARRWQILDAEDNIIDDTETTVAGSNNRTYQNIFTGIFTTNAMANATPGELEYLVYTAGGWTNGAVADNTTLISDVLIYDELTISGNISVKTLSVANGGKITVPANTVLTVDGTITNNGEFTVENDGILIQNNAVANTGAITVKRNSNPMFRLDYTLWSSPVAMNLVDFSDVSATSPTAGNGTLWNRVYTLGASAWDQVWTTQPDVNNDTTPFIAGQGYLYRSPNLWVTRDSGNPATAYEGIFNGVPNNGNITATTPYEFSSIGNPYPSPIDADILLQENTDIDFIYFWTNTHPPVGGSYDEQPNNWAYYNLAGGTGTDGGEDPNGIIQTGQGFVAKMMNAAAGVNFNNGQRINANGAFFRTMATERSRFWLNLSNEVVTFNQILVGYMDNATQGIDTGIDAKMFGYEGNALYSIIENSQENYVIQGRSLPFEASDVVALGFRAVNAGSFTISLHNFDGLFAEGNTTIYLKDNYTQTQHNLMSGAYSFISDEGMFDNRFEVVYQTTMNVENPVANNSNWVVYNQGEGYQIQTQGFELQNVTVFDLLGRTIYTSKAEGTGHNLPALGADSVYIVKVTTTDNVVLSKKVK